MLHAEEDAIDIDCLLAAPVLMAHLEDRGADADTGIVDENVEPAELVLNGCDDFLPARLARHVMAVSACCAAGLGDDLDRFLEARLVHVGHDDLGPLGGQRDCRPPADTARRARDQRHLAAYPSHVFLPEASYG